MACPHVSGVAALIVSHFGGQGFTAEELRTRLIQGARPISASTGSKPIGPMLDALGSFQLNGSGAQAPDAVTEFSVSPVGHNIKVDFKAVEAYGYMVVASRSASSLEKVSYDNPASDISYASKVLMNAEPGSDQNIVLTGLTPDKDYYVSIVAYSYDRKSSLRNLKKYTTITRDFDVWCNQFIDVSEKANLLMLGANSIYGRTYCKAAGYCEKYTHTRYTANNEDLFAANIWGNEAGFSSASLYYMQPAQYSGNNFDKVTTWRINEHAKIADAVAETVTPYMFFPALTVDETLLVRAEARVLQGKYEKAAQDLTLWMQNNIKTEMVLTPEKILSFYADHGDFTYATWDNSTDG